MLRGVDQYYRGRENRWEIVSTVGLQVRAVICANQWEGEWPAVAGRGVETGVGRTVGFSVLSKLFRKLAVSSDP